MPPSRDPIRAHYAQGQEWARLEGEEGWLEWERTLLLLRRHLPPGRARVLDLGGGPGRYTLALAAWGHQPTLVDLSPELLQEAEARLQAAGQRAQVEGVCLADAADLSALPGPPFDAVLALGPLYHAADAADLQQMVDEVARVLRPGGVVLGAFIPRISGLADLVARTRSPPGALGHLLETGHLSGGADRSGTFFPHPAQVRAAFIAHFAEVGIFSLRGIAAGYGASLRHLRDQDPARFAEVMDLVDATAAREDVIGLGWHALYIGHRRPSDRG